MAAERQRTMVSCLPDRLIEGQSQCGEDAAHSEGSTREQLDHRHREPSYPQFSAATPFMQPAFGWHEKFCHNGGQVAHGTVFDMEQLARSFGTACALDQRGRGYWTPGCHPYRRPPDRHAAQGVQPCRDFLHNRCFKGDKCIYSHDMEHIRHVNTPQDGSCMSFVFGVCELPLCRFKHDINMVKNLLLAELQRSGPPAGHKGGVCLEYLRGTCTKGDGCLFSHALKDYYAHVCKRKPHACIAKRTASESLLAALVADQPAATNLEQAAQPNEHCQRSHVLRSLVPTLIPGDPKRAEAVIAALEAHPSIAPGIIPVYEKMQQQGSVPVPEGSHPQHAHTIPAHFGPAHMAHLMQRQPPPPRPPPPPPPPPPPYIDPQMYATPASPGMPQQAAQAMQPERHFC